MRAEQTIYPIKPLVRNKNSAQNHAAVFINPFLRVPIFLAVGIGLYFYLVVEPSLFLLNLTPFLLILLLFFSQEGGTYKVFFALFLIVIGFNGAQLRSVFKYHLIFPQKTETYQLKGQVISTMQSKSGRKIYFLKLSDLAIKRKPDRFGDISKYEFLGQEKLYQLGMIRLSSNQKKNRLWVGDWLCTTANLRGPPRPVAPGFFDIRRLYYYQNISATGFAISKLKQCHGQDKANVSRWTYFFQKLRQSISSQISKYMDGDVAGLTKAIIIGERGQISREMHTKIRRSGLAHLLAISGLHMGVFAGFVFYLTRLILAYFSRLTLNLPIKKIAAITGFIAGVIYLNLTPFSVSTQRAFIMMSVMTLAIIFNKPAISFSNLALAAIIILITQPEQLLSPGFQMSFAASMVLIALYNRSVKWDYIFNFSILWVIKPIASLFLASLMASLITAPIALYHFQEASMAGVWANLIAIPLFSMVIIPLCVVFLISIPLQMDGLVLMILSWFQEQLLQLADLFSSMKTMVAVMPQLSTITFLSLLLSLYLIWKIIATKKIKTYLLYLLPVGALGCLSQWQQIQPILYLHEDGQQFMIKDDVDQSHLSPGRGNSFAARKWLKANGSEKTVKQAKDTKLISCDETGCFASLNSIQFYKIDHLSLLHKICSKKEQRKIILSKFKPEAAKSCEQLEDGNFYINRHDLKTYGTHVFYRGKSGNIIYKTSAEQGPIQHLRPWQKEDELFAR